MRKKLYFGKNDRIAVIAPHPDDECFGAAAVLIFAPEKTDIYVISDGSHGNPAVENEKEAAIRKAQFKAEMLAVRPHAWEWLGYEDTTLSDHPEAAYGIDFTKYSKVFLPWDESYHPDHRAAARSCFRAIYMQDAKADCFMYEVNASFWGPTHFIDITDIIDEKKRLIRFHADQDRYYDEEINLLLNEYRGAQIRRRFPECIYAEAYMKTDARSKGRILSEEEE